MRADAQANRAALLAVARRLIATRGARVTLSAVAEEAGIGIATLYRNFPTHRALLHAVIVGVGEQMLDILRRAPAALVASPEQGWRDIVGELVAVEPGALLPAFVEEVEIDGWPDDFTPVRNDAIDALRVLLQQASSLGLVEADLTPEQFQLGLATITRPLPDLPLPERVDLTAWLVEVYLRGLRPVHASGE